MPTVSEAQRRAMWAAAEGRSTLGIPQKVGKEFVAADASAPIAAGVVFVAPDAEILLLRRAGEEGVDNFVGHWALPGGGGEPGETPEDVARREAAEELGNMAPDGSMKLLDVTATPTGMHFYTFVQPVETKFWPRLNDEHSGAGWFSLDRLPRPMHPAVRTMLGNRLGLGLAEDLPPEGWAALRTNFAKWTREEEAEAEHADDAAFEEGKHPRDAEGKFGSGGGSSSAKKPKLSPTEKTYLASYSGDDFLRLNKEIRSGQSGGPAAQKIDSAIAKSTVPAGTKLYRGISKDALKSLIGGDEITLGQTFSDKAFVSTSKSDDIAGMNSIGGVKLEIDVGEGQHGLDMEGISDNAHEKEVILPRDTKFKIESIKAAQAVGKPIRIKVSIVRNEHASDNQPMLATAANTGMPALSGLIAGWNKRAKKEAKRAQDADVCPLCGGTGELAGPGVTCDECGGSGKIAKGDCAFDMGLFIRNLAQDSRAEPEHTLTIRYDGDFSFKGLIAHLHKLGAIGASRTIEARDEEDKIVPFGWDGDGADKIHDAEIDGEQLAFDRVMVMGLYREGLAFDKAPGSVRTTDADGRMHVEISNISKAIVNPYMGKEIPKYRELGLEPDKIYQLLRDPGELQKAAPTFNNLPLLDEHVGVNAADHKPQHVIGSTGTDSVFEHPHLKNSLVVWANRGIKAIESEKKKELSSAYRYRADMTPGNYEGVRYDGVMRDIVGNHVALVEEGRAGSDVVVGDSANPLTQERPMKVKLSPLGTVAYGALMTFLRPQLAQDAKLDLSRGLRSITAKNFKTKRPTLAAWITESVKDKLNPEFAQDGALNVDGLDAVLDMVEMATDDFPEEMEKKKDAKDEKPTAGAKDEESDEDADMAGDEEETDEEKTAREKKEKGAKDKKAKDKKAKDAKKAKDKDVNEEDEETDAESASEMADDESEEEKERAMDAQIQAGIEAGIRKERQRMEAVTAAKEHVRARVGNLSMAFDSAADVYRKALSIATGKEPPKKADADTLKYAFDSLPAKDGQQRRTFAFDSSPNTAASTIAKRSPDLAKNMARIGRA